MTKKPPTPVKGKQGCAMGKTSRDSNGYTPLLLTLAGYWAQPFDELPKGIAELVQHHYACVDGWDRLTPEDRRSVAAQTDYAADPKHEPVAYFQMAVLQDEIGQWIKKAREESKDSVAVALGDVKDRIESILDSDRERVGADIQALRDTRRSAGVADLRTREKTTYLNIIGALLELVLTPRPERNSQAAVISELVENYGDKPGISKATLEQKFAEAKLRLRQ